MNVSIIGPEGSGKTSLANAIAQKLSFGRIILFVGKKKSEFQKAELADLHKVRNAVVIIDDANAVLESIDVYNKTLRLKEPFILHRENNVLFIGVFHSFDDAVKYFFRQSRFIYVSAKYRDTDYLKNKYIKGIQPTQAGHKKFPFWCFKRY